MKESYNPEDYLQKFYKIIYGSQSNVWLAM